MWRSHDLEPGQRVLDLGCGCGTDAFIAAAMAGPRGRVVGIDLSPEMLGVARSGLRGRTPPRPEFLEGNIEQLPFEDASFDVVLSNGVLNLVPDKRAAFREIHRVLSPGGVFAAADVFVLETVPPDLLASMDAWST